MATANQSLRPLAMCSRCLKYKERIALPIRTLTTKSPLHARAEAKAVNPASLPPLVATHELDPNTIASISEERRLIKHRGEYPVGSRRRRAVISSLKNAIPLEQLPYQCFQEARKLLAEDRAEKIAAVEKMRLRIGNLLEQDASISGGEQAKQHRLRSMRKELEKLKILADINDPMVKKRFEDGMGDMNKPIYRYLAEKKWRSMKYKILVQRLTQMNVTPDVLANLDPILDIDILWNGRLVGPGDFVPSITSENAPALRIQKFDKGSTLVTIVAVDSDVPNVEADSFETRCLGMWSNIKLSPTEVDTGALGSKNDNTPSTVVPWVVPHALKGAPYHRISLFVFEQPNGEAIAIDEMKKLAKQRGHPNFSLRTFAAHSKFKAIGATLFRSQWDSDMAAVMERNGIEGADLEFRRRAPEKLPQKYRIKDGLRYRGWKK